MKHIQSASCPKFWLLVYKSHDNFFNLFFFFLTSYDVGHQSTTPSPAAGPKMRRPTVALVKKLALARPASSPRPFLPSTPLPRPIKSLALSPRWTPPSCFHRRQTSGTVSAASGDYTKYEEWLSSPSRGCRRPLCSHSKVFQ